MAAFGTKAINYHEARADNDFEWDVRYDLSFLNSESLTTIRVDLVSEDPGSMASVWRNGVNEIWNNKAFFSDGNRLYEAKTDFSFVDTGAHHTVNVHTGTGRSNMTDWFLGGDISLQDEIAAHEVGHMFGLFDQYEGGATYNRYTTTGTLMSDLTKSAFDYYIWPQEYYTEYYGEMSLSRLLGKTGTASNDTLTGGSGMDGFYGLAGNDTISGSGGNDFLDGGAGRDILTGGAGADIFDYDLISDTGNTSTSRDVIKDFVHLTDDIDLAGMDASSILSGNNAFVWRGTGGITTSTYGELRYQKYDNAGTTDDYTLLYGDTDGDTASEFQIQLSGLVSLSSSDLLV